MRNIPIVGKFLIIMAVFGLFAIGSALYSGWQMKQIDAGYSQLVDKTDKAALLLARANRMIYSARGSIGDVLMAATPADAKKSVDDLATGRSQFLKYMNDAIAALPEVTDLPPLKAKGQQILYKDCQPAVDAALAATDEGGRIAAQALYFKECLPKLMELSPKIVEATNVQIAASESTNENLSIWTNQTITYTLIGVIIALFLVLAGGYAGIRAWLVVPIRSLATSMSALAEGNFGIEVGGTARRDEVGGMARALQIFKDNGIRARALEQDAEALRLAAEQERLQQEERDRKRSAEMAAATDGLAKGLKQLAAGDLSYRIDQTFATEFEALRADFNQACDQLSQTLGAIADSTTAIDGGSREISHGTQDLSRRTEQQAASLEETAAALDEITANVTNASKRTEEARGMAAEANLSARRSGEVVASAVDAMQRIEQSSTQISNIIGVIDEIAFQTNLLALNAGVEAARAGEAGKGFAVVAQEVRELAQRSAQAAKEIKSLIQSSASEVGAGVKLVRETGEALRVIESHVVTINEQLDAIATSAREQATGLAEVNQAVNQMDQVTQQNAAMVEQSTAASAALASEAVRMKDLVSQFRLAQGATASASYHSDRPATLPAASAASASKEKARPQPAKAASTASRPVASPARAMIGKIAKAVGLAAPSPEASEGWEDF